MKKYVLGPNAARKLKALLAKSDGVSRRPAGSSAVASDLEYAAPFTVKWAASANGGEGAWIIWLPSTELLVVHGEAVDLTADLEAAGGDYPDGWFVIDDETLEASGGDLYLKITRAAEQPESDAGEFAAEFVGSDDLDDEDDDAESLAVVVASCAVDSDTDAKSVRQFLDSALVIGGLPAMVAGDGEGSEWLKMAGRKLIIQAYPGHGEGADEEDNCGLIFTTVSEREEDGEKIPAKVIVSVKDKDPEENWAAKEMKIPLAGGGTKLVHFLGCDDVDLTGLGGGGGSGGGGDTGGCGCEGSDYVEVETQTETDGDGNETTKKVIKAKIATQSDNAHALITNDTEQKIKAKKTFTAPVIVGNENGKHFKLDASQIPASCAGQIQLRELKIPGNDPQNSGTFHFLGCSNIDLTGIIGKTIKSTAVSATTNGSKLVFTYTDGSYDTFIVQNGLPGAPGTPGQDGDTPEITSARNGNVTHIFADGALIASVADGSTPQITATKSGKITTIYANGTAIATISDGEDGGGGDEYERKSFISGIRFEESGGKLKAIISKTEIAVPNWDGVRYIETEDAQTIDVCDVKEIDVVTEGNYSTGSHQFTNTRKRIKVLGSANAQSQTPFTATPLSGE